MVINTGQAFQRYPVFYVHGCRQRLVYKSRLHVARASGKMILLFGGAERPRDNLEVNIEVDSLADIEGFVYSNGWAHIRGKLTGSFLCENLRHFYKGTIYLSHLKDGKVSPFPPGTVLSFPSVFELPSNARALQWFPDSLRFGNKP